MNMWVKIAVGAVVAVGLLIVVALNLWISTRVKTAIVQIGPQLTQTTVELEDVHVGLLGGLVQLDGLEVGNPPGFTAPIAMKVGTARIRLDVLSTFSDTVVIDEILMEAPDITFEGLPRSNLSVIQDNVNAAVPAGSSKRVEAAKKLLIKEFILTKGRVAARVSDQSLRLGLPDIHLKDMGKESGGVTPEQAVSAVFTAITQLATSAVTEQAKKAAEAGKEAKTTPAESVKRLFKK